MGRNAEEDTVNRDSRQLLTDIAVGLGLAVLVVLIVAFSSHTEPTFIYQAF